MSATDKHADGRYYDQTREVGTEPVESSQTGSNSRTITFGKPVAFVDLWNGGATIATLTAGGRTLHIPPNGGSLLCEFPTLETDFVLVCTGDWIAAAYK